MDSFRSFLRTLSGPSRRTSGAFTLIELLVVILVLGVLIAVAVPSYLGHQRRAHDTSAKQQLTISWKAARAEAASNAVDAGKYPTVGLPGLMKASEPQLNFPNGTTCTDADGQASDRDVVFDTDSSAGSNLVLYNQSGSDTIFRLRAANTGAPIIDAVCGGAGSGTQTPVSAAPPSTTSTGGSSGTQPQEGIPTTGSPGTWTSPDGNPTTATHQWQVCDAAGENCEDIAGATGSSYTPVAADVGVTIRDEITVCGDAGCTIQPTPTAGPVLPPTPTTNGTEPVITNGGGATVFTPVDGTPINASQGGWTGGTSTPTSYSYQWQHGSSSTGPWSNAFGPGSQTSSYTPAYSATASQTDVDKFLRVCVTASNSGGSTQSCSNSIGPVTAAPPVLVTGPTRAGFSPATYGQQMTTTTGSWEGHATATPALNYSYQWQRCNAAGVSCVAIAGADASDDGDYTPVLADVDNTIRVIVTAINNGSGGTSTSNTSPVSAVVTGAPVNTGAPAAPSGTTTQGQTLTANNGTWNPAATSYAYQWQRGAADIAGATGGTYTLVYADAGNTMRVRVTATNASGSSAPIYSASTASVTGLAPAAPAGLGTSAGQYSLNLSWSASANASSYTYYLNGGSATGTTGTSGGYGGLGCNTTYTLGVRANNAWGSSAISSTTATTTACPPPPVSINSFSQLHAHWFGAVQASNWETALAWSTSNAVYGCGLNGPNAGIQNQANDYHAGSYPPNSGTQLIELRCSGPGGGAGPAQVYSAQP